MTTQNIIQRFRPGMRYAIVLLAVILFVAYFVGTAGNGSDSPAANTPLQPLPPSTDASVSTSTHTIVAFGDSITAGYGIDVSDAYPSLLNDLLREKGHNVTVINAGVSGETTAGGLRRADFVVAQKPDIVIVALGGNDVLRGIPPSNTRENLGLIIEKFQTGGARVILAGMYAPENLGEVYVAEFNALYPALATEYKVPLVPFLLAGVALDPARNQQDGIHPNKEGALIIARENILPVLLPLLAQE